MRAIEYRPAIPSVHPFVCNTRELAQNGLIYIIKNFIPSFYSFLEQKIVAKFRQLLIFNRSVNQSINQSIN